MGNVMKKAWEIAREGQKKFGGNVKEYFAQALKMAWNIAKKVMSFGYQVVQKKNGVMWFVVNDVEGIEVSFLSKKLKYGYTNQFVTKRNVMNDFRKGVNNQTQQPIRMHNVAINSGDIEIKLGDDVEIVKNSR